MEFNRRAVDELPRSSDHHPPLRYDYFPEQPPRGDILYGDPPFYKERIRDGIVALDVGRRSVEAELRRDLNLKKDLLLRERIGDEVGRFRGGMLSLHEERDLEDRIARRVEEGIAVTLESRIVTAFERSGIVERIARAVEESVGRSLEERIVTTFKRSGMMDTIARSVENGLGISLEGRIAALEKSRAAAAPKNGIVKVPSSPVEPKVLEAARPLSQPPSHVVKEATSEAIHCNANAPSGPSIKNIASTAVEIRTPKEDWRCSICNIRTTSKGGLDDHLKGKKHLLMIETGSMTGTKRKNPHGNVLPLNKKNKANQPDNLLP